MRKRTSMHGQWRWLLVARNTVGGADFCLGTLYFSRREALWNKKRLKVPKGYRPVRFRLTETANA